MPEGALLRRLDDVTHGRARCLESDAPFDVTDSVVPGCATRKLE
jgi:hypothetical protein